MSVSAVGAKLPLELWGCPFSAYIYIDGEKGGGADIGRCMVEARGCRDDSNSSHSSFAVITVNMCETAVLRTLSLNNCFHTYS